MTDSTAYSKLVKLIKLVENHECIWNSEIPQQHKRDEIKYAWKEISTHFPEPLTKVRERWRNIRNSFKRSLNKTTVHGTQEGNKTKDYYLADQLQFLLPHIQGNMDCDNSSSWDDYTDITISSYDENDFTEEDNNEEILQTDDNGSVTTFQISHVPETKTTKEKNNQKNYVPTATASTSDEVTKKRKLFDIISNQPTALSLARDKHRLQEDANLYFLKSLLPDMNSMNSLQNRKFRKNVITLIDNTLSHENNSNENIRIANDTTSPITINGRSDRSPECQMDIINDKTDQFENIIKSEYDIEV